MSTQITRLEQAELGNGIKVVLDFGSHKYVGKAETDLYRVLVAENVRDTQEFVVATCVHFRKEADARSAYELAASATAGGSSIHLPGCQGALSLDELEPDPKLQTEAVAAISRFKEAISPLLLHFPGDSVLRTAHELLSYSPNLGVRVRDPQLVLVARRIDNFRLTFFRDTVKGTDRPTVILDLEKE